MSSRPYRSSIRSGLRVPRRRMAACQDQSASLFQLPTKLFWRKSSTNNNIPAIQTVSQDLTNLSHAYPNDALYLAKVERSRLCQYSRYYNVLILHHRMLLCLRTCANLHRQIKLVFAKNMRPVFCIYYIAELYSWLIMKPIILCINVFEHVSITPHCLLKAPLDFVYTLSKI